MKLLTTMMFALAHSLTDTIHKCNMLRVYSGTCRNKLPLECNKFLDVDWKVLPGPWIATVSPENFSLHATSFYKLSFLDHRVHLNAPSSHIMFQHPDTENNYIAISITTLRVSLPPSLRKVYELLGGFRVKFNRSLLTSCHSGKVGFFRSGISFFVTKLPSWLFAIWNENIFNL